MNKYEKPTVQFKSSFHSIFETQYIFVITPNECLRLSNDGAVGVEGGLAFCDSGPESPGFSAVITCQNIGGSYSAVYGDAVAGGGLNCGGEVSVIYPIISISPDLPQDCIVESFVLHGSNQC